MKIYTVAVTETRRKAVSVRADSRQDAEQRALDAWKNTEFVLDDFEDFEGVDAEALDDGAEDDGTLPYDTVLGGYGSEHQEEGRS
ncbi:MAG: DpnD/PcfM family protein [Synergistaceae bacterium]|nr:DpnD/PcfM family protein [Synergistaceae bacterium]